MKNTGSRFGPAHMAISIQSMYRKLSELVLYNQYHRDSFSDLSFKVHTFVQLFKSDIQCTFIKPIDLNIYLVSFPMGYFRIMLPLEIDSLLVSMAPWASINFNIAPCVSIRLLMILFAYAVTSCGVMSAYSAHSKTMRLCRANIKCHSVFFK